MCASLDSAASFCSILDCYLTNGTIIVDFKVAEFDVHIKEKQWLSSSLLKVRR